MGIYLVRSVPPLGEVRRGLLLEIFLTQNEVASEIFLANNLVGSEFLRITLEKYPPLEEQIGTVGDAQSLVHVVVGNEYANVAVLQLPDNLLNVADGNGVDTGKRLVEHDKLRIYGQTTRYLCTAAFTTGKAVTGILAHFL